MVSNEMEEEVNNETESLEPRAKRVAKKTWSETAAAAGVLSMVQADAQGIEEVLHHDATKKKNSEAI